MFLVRRSLHFSSVNNPQRSPTALLQIVPPMFLYVIVAKTPCRHTFIMYDVDWVYNGYHVDVT